MLSSNFIPRRFLAPIFVFSILAFTALILTLRNETSLSSFFTSRQQAYHVTEPYHDPAVDRFVIDNDDSARRSLVYYTVTQTTTSVETVTATVEHEVTETVTTTQYARIRPLKPVATTVSVKRDYMKWGAPDEDFSVALTEADQESLKTLGYYKSEDLAEKVEEKLSPRQQRLKRMYELDGAEDWLRFIKENDDGAMPPLTKWAQEYIYKWQHPPKEDCKNKKFIVLSQFWDKNGLGTVVHGTGRILGIAMRTGRIVVFNNTDSPGRNFFETGCPMGRNAGDGKSFDCVFERFSSCGQEDITEGNWISAKGYWMEEGFWETSSSAVPPIFGYALKQQFPEMHGDAIKYWWRAQASAYMLRMNGPSLRRLREMRLDPDIQVGFTHTRNPSQNPYESELVLSQVPVPFPLPDGSFSMHVRHGDKGSEMELIPFIDYVARAEEHAAMNPLTSRKIGFISSEDPKVFEEARSISNLWLSTNTTSNTYWTWLYSDIPRINGSPKKQLNSFGNRTDMTIKWMSQMFFAIEASNILGTRGSSWNRMIDEARCVWMDCRQGYMEVGPFEDWIHYNY